VSKQTSNSNKTFVLLVSTDEPDRRALQQLLDPWEWRILTATNPIEARQMLADMPVAVVIADSRCWKSLLPEMWMRGFSLIVADRLADERLWAEVLNLGAYDLVSKPFEADVLLHLLNAATARRYRHADSSVITGSKTFGCHSAATR
jgi:DNA-binding NtrC family response regulator